MKSRGPKGATKGHGAAKPAGLKGAAKGHGAAKSARPAMEDKARGAGRPGADKPAEPVPGKRQNWRASNMLYPVPVVLVGCRDREGKDNLMTAAWAGTVCSDPVMVSV